MRRSPCHYDDYSDDETDVAEQRTCQEDAEEVAKDERHIKTLKRRETKRIFQVSSQQKSNSNIMTTTKPYLHRQLESDYDGGDGNGDEEKEPDLVALALGVQAEGQHERHEVAQSLKDRGQGF